MNWVITHVKDNLIKGFLSEEYDTEPQTRFCTMAYLPILNDPEFVKKTILGEELILKEDWVKYVNEVLYGFDTLTIPNTSESLDGQDTNNRYTVSQDWLMCIKIKTFVRRSYKSY